jgi:phytoene synthase
LPTPEFWYGALAVQLAHEASLLHDDVIDRSSRRRGAATIAASHGVPAALVQGDHLLTTAYRYAARTRSPLFVEIFAESVERTVAGELAQARASGKIISFDEYTAIVNGKSGALLGCALSLAPAIVSPDRARRFHETGCRLGLVYQMLDDLLDLSPETETGKPSLSDFAQGHWTWPLEQLSVDRFGAEPRAIVRALHAVPSRVPTAGRRCLTRYQALLDKVLFEVREQLGESSGLEPLLFEWGRTAQSAIEREEAAASAANRVRRPSSLLAERASAISSEIDYLSRHSRSFLLATRFFPRDARQRVARVYAYCRFTDDLVDDPAIDSATASSLLEEWMDLSFFAYTGGSSGIPFLDRVMHEMAEVRVPFMYAHELGQGMRMDLRGERYGSLLELRRYTYRVASVVGLWISELFDVRDPSVLSRAAQMGHAMQLTNILRDVGEDIRAGRCYLPRELMHRYGVTEADLIAGRVTSGYVSLMKEMIAWTEAAYRSGSEGIASLPAPLRVPVAVASQVYRGIIDEIVANNYDTLTVRAHTSAARKALLVAKAFMRSPLRSRGSHTIGGRRSVSA